MSFYAEGHVAQDSVLLGFGIALVSANFQISHPPNSGSITKNHSFL